MKVRKVKKAAVKKAGEKAKGLPDLQLDAGRARSVQGGFAAVEHKSVTPSPRPPAGDPFARIGDIKGE